MKETGPHRVESHEWLSCAPFEKLLNMKIVEAVDGSAVLTMPFLQDLAQGAGLMHGGALVSLADTAVVMAVKTLVVPQTHFVTVSCETQFLHPVKHGVVTARAHVTSREERILYGEAILYNDAGCEVMQFHSIFKITRDVKNSPVR